MKSGIEEKQIEVFHDSLRRCESQDSFYDFFYDHFISSSEEVAEKFKNTDLVKQKRMLRKSLALTPLAIIDDNSAKDFLLKIAKRHSREDLDIQPHLYELWLDSLISSVKKFDARFDDQIEKAWRDMMEVGINYMKSLY